MTIKQTIGQFAALAVSAALIIATVLALNVRLAAASYDIENDSTLAKQDIEDAGPLVEHDEEDSNAGVNLDEEAYGGSFWNHEVDSEEAGLNREETSEAYAVAEHEVNEGYSGAREEVAEYNGSFLARVFDLSEIRFSRELDENSSGVGHEVEEPAEGPCTTLASFEVPGDSGAPCETDDAPAKQSSPLFDEIAEEQPYEGDCFQVELAHFEEPQTSEERGTCAIYELS